MTKHLQRPAIPNDVLDRILELERRLDDLEGFAALPTIDPETGGDTYVEVLQEVEVLEGDGLDVEGSAPSYTVNLGMEYPLVWDGTNPPTEYATLALAIAAASSGDTIWLPPGTYSGDHTIPDGVTVAAMSALTAELTGQIILPNNGIDAEDMPGLTGVRINRSANDSNTLKGVIAPSSGGCKVVSCAISCVQSGSGDAYTVVVDDAGDVAVWGSHLYASSGTGTPYAGYRASGVDGNMYLFNCVLPMTDPLSE